MEKESEISEYLKERIKDEFGGECRKFHSSVHTGWPDRDILIPGGYVWYVELKKGKGKPEKLQELQGKWLVNNGFNYRLISSKKEVDDFIDHLKTTYFYNR